MVIYNLLYVRLQNNFHTGNLWELGVLFKKQQMYYV